MINHSNLDDETLIRHVLNECDDPLVLDLAKRLEHVTESSDETIQDLSSNLEFANDELDGYANHLRAFIYTNELDFPVEYDLDNLCDLMDFLTKVYVVELNNEIERLMNCIESGG